MHYSHIISLFEIEFFEEKKTFYTNYFGGNKIIFQ